jgi:hypothetical protein
MIEASNKKGVTAMETLIGIGLVSVIVMTVYSSLIGAMNNATESRKRTGALALANEKMEFIRNLEYNEIGTIQGIVPGLLYSSEKVSKNNCAYNIKTEVRYIDDLADGVAPFDLINNDYKQVHVEVDWGVPEKSVSLYSVFVPNGLETNIHSGTLSINVIDSTGVPVPAVSVEIKSLDDNPIVDYATGTDDSGNLILPGVPSQHYRIFLSKSGYENVMTYPSPITEDDFTPFDTDLFVAEANLNTKTFFMDKSAELTLKAIDIETNEGIENVSFDIKGGKKIGINPDTFNLDEIKSTDSSGNATFSNISSGEYLIENIDSLDTDNYAYVGTEERLPIQLHAEEIHESIFLFADKNQNSLVVSVKDSIGEPLKNASVTLTDGVFNQTILTGEEGLVFFPQAPDILTAGSYELSVSLDGYSDYNGNIEINDLVKESITLSLE